MSKPCAQFQRKYVRYVLVEGTMQLCRTSKLTINAKDKDSTIHEQARKNLKGLGFDPGSICSLGKCNRVPGHTSSGDFSQLVPAKLFPACSTHVCDLLMLCIKCSIGVQYNYTL